jgi:hypothetical protein
MAAQSTKDWMLRNKFRAITIYLPERLFERVHAAAQEDGRSKGSWVRHIVIEWLRKRADQ